MRRFSLFVVAGLCGLLASTTAQAQWGSLKGQIVLADPAPVVKPLVVKGMAPKDGAVCAAAADIPDDSLAIDPKSNGIANVAVWLVAKKDLKVNPNLAKSEAAKVVFDQVNCRFIPHVLVVRTDQVVNVISGDGVAHNTRGTPLKNQGFNFIVAPNDRVGTDQAMKLGERLPVQIGCDIHPWMRGYWVVSDHPYAAVTDKDGNFEIKDLPVGEHEFKIWHERPGYAYKDKKDPKKGLLVKIENGKTTEVPVIKIPLATLEAKK